MSEERRGQAMTNPLELWRQWFETGTKMWSDVFQAGRDNNQMDPYGLYRQWFKSLEDFQEQMLGAMGGASSLMAKDGSLTSPTPSPGTGDPAAAAKPVADTVAGQAAEVQNLWKQWFEAAQDSWQKALGLGAEMVDLTPRWFAMLDQIRNNLLSAEGYPTDPLQFATRWYNATNGPLSDFISDLMEREEILDVSSQSLQSYASFYKVFRRNSEEYLKGLSLPVRSDMTRVAGLVVALEDKIDRLEEAFEDFEYGYAEPATAESLATIEERIGGLENTLERIGQDGAGAATADSVSSLESRLDDVEAKIDQILAALEGIPQNGGLQTEAQTESSQQETAEASQEEAPQDDETEVRATAAARRKAQEFGVDLAEVDGTGSNGQITIEDVRRENTREEGEES